MQKVWMMTMDVLDNDSGQSVVMVLLRKEKFVIVEQFQLVVKRVVFRLAHKPHGLVHWKAVLNVAQAKVLIWKIFFIVFSETLGTFKATQAKTR